VPADAPGITWLDTWDHLGLRASNTHDVVYDEVPVPLDAFVEIPYVSQEGVQGGVYRDPAAETGIAGFGHVALYVGVARAARAAFVRYAQERVPAALGRPIATTERIQTVAGEIDAQIATAETILHGALLRASPHDGRAGDTGHIGQLSVLKVQVALVDPEHNWEPMNEVYNTFFPKNRPARSYFGSTGFRRRGQLLQIDCIAYVD